MLVDIAADYFRLNRLLLHRAVLYRVPTPAIRIAAAQFEVNTCSRR